MHTVRSGDVEIPALGFGTWNLKGPEAQAAVEIAIGLGYRHIDTAAIYGNETEVGAAIAASGVPRDHLFVTTKIWTDAFRDGDLQVATGAALARLGLDHVDLLLLHWPKATPALEETLGAINEVKGAGLTRAIGVSNFPSALFREAQDLAQGGLATNQVEYHPYLTQRAVKAALAEAGASLTAWSPLAQGKVVDDPVLKAIGQAHDKTAGQVTLRWLVQQDGVIAIPKTASAVRAAENLDVFDFVLTPDEMARIDALGSPAGRIGDWIDPAFRWDAG